MGVKGTEAKEFPIQVGSVSSEESSPDSMFFLTIHNMHVR